MSRPAELHGILAVDKPAGWTSHDVVAKVRRIAGQRQVGHGGTLDPLATGLLPLGLGQGTRVLEYFSSGGKSYQATIRLGAATDTYDAEGTVTEQAPWEHVTPAALQLALATFTGTISQRPPMYSAIKLHGVALHRLARRGESVEIPERAVTIDRIDVLGFTPPLIELDVACGGGTYIRSLAHDLGHSLDSAAHVVALRRTRVGTLTLADAVTLDALVEGGAARLEDRLLALDRPLWSLPAAILNEAHGRDVQHGRPYRPARGDGPYATVYSCRAYGADGSFVALLRFDAATGNWRPEKVFRQAGQIVS